MIVYEVLHSLALGGFDGGFIEQKEVGGFLIVWER